VPPSLDYFTPAELDALALIAAGCSYSRGQACWGSPRTRSGGASAAPANGKPQNENPDFGYTNHEG